MHETPLVMPKMSMTMTEGELVAWQVTEGESVAAGQVVCVVATDKVDMEVEAPAAGTVSRLLAEPGTVLPVGAPLARIAGESEDLLAGLLPDPVAGRPPATAAGSRRVTAAEPPPAAAAELHLANGSSVLPSRVRALPGARRRAAERGLDLASVKGSGPGGVVTLRDVEDDGGAPRRRAARARLTARLQDSAAIPQFTVWRDLDLEQPAHSRGTLSWTALLLRALAGALREAPAFTRGAHDGVTVSLAVDGVHGLLAPSFTDPDRVGAEELDAEIGRTVERARRGRIDPAHLVPGPVVLYDLGPLGAERFTAPVLPPQVAVLTVGEIAPRAVVSGGGIHIRTGCTVGLTVDHRVADGPAATRLLGSLAAIVQSPSRRTHAS